MERQPARGDVAHWRVGEVVAGTYEVTGVLGRGGMGVVHRVRHLGWNTDLAVKSPLPDLVGSPVDREGFVREAETWMGLGLHPHVCTCHYVRTLDGVPRVFAEYAAAGSLRDWIDDGRLYEGSGRDALARVLDIAIQAAWGLDHAHGQRLVHQDVKPANILLDPAGTAKISDFGLARSQRRGTPAAPAAAGGATLLVTSGGLTPAYASPEQAAGAALGRRSDVWSLAVSLLEVLAGEVTWVAGSVAGGALAALRAQERPTRVSLSPALAGLLAGCLAEDPAARPHMADVADALIALYGDEVGRPYPRSAPKPLQTRADELNNRALSLLDLGRTQEALALFDEARAADPHHPEVLYNSGLLRWRSGALTDDALVHELEASRVRSTEPGRITGLLARVHTERGDRDAARALREPGASGGPAAEAAGGPPAGPGGEGSAVTVLSSHSDGASDVCVTPDGRYAVSTGRDRSVRFWEVDSGRLVRTSDGLPGYRVCLTPDAALVLSAGNGERVYVWEAATGRPVRDIGTRGAEADGSDPWAFKVLAVCATPDGRHALTVDWGGHVQLWDIATGRLVRAFEGHTTLVNCVCVTSDGRLALTGSGPRERLVRVWDLATGECLRVLEHGSEVNDVCTTADGRRALSAGGDRTVRVWDVATGRQVRVLSGHTDIVNSVCVTPDGRHALTGGNDGTVRVWDLDAGRCLRTLTGHTLTVGAVCTTPDGRHAISASVDDTLRVWHDVVPPAQPGAFQLCHPRSHDELAGLAARVEWLVDEARTAMDAQRHAAALTLLQQARDTRGHAEDTRVRQAWAELAPYCTRTGLDGVHLAAVLDGGPVNGMCVSRDGRLAVTVGDDHQVRVWRTDTGELLHNLTGHGHSVVSVCLTADGRRALTAGDETVRVWDVVAGRQMHVLRGHTSYAHCVRVTPDGRYAVSGAQDATTRIWDTHTGELLHTLPEHINSGYAMDISPNGRLVASTDRSGKALRLWDLTSGRQLHCLEGHTEKVDAACVTADGRYVLTASWDGTARLWDIRTGRCLRTLRGHIGAVGDVAVTPDGRYALTAGRDATARVWDLATGETLHTLTGHQESVTSVCVTPDGHRALTAGYDGTVRLWNLDWRLTAREPAGWDDAAHPYLEAFLTRHALTAGGIAPLSLRSRLRTPKPRPVWTEEDFDRFYRRLQQAGYGHLDRTAVGTRLEREAHAWRLRDAHP